MMYVPIHSCTMGVIIRVGRNYSSFPGASVHSMYLTGFTLLNLQFYMKCFVDYCLSFCLFLVAVVLAILRFTASDYTFGILKLFL